MAHGKENHDIEIWYFFPALMVVSSWSVIVLITFTSSRYGARNNPALTAMMAQITDTLTVVTAIGMCRH